MALLIGMMVAVGAYCDDPPTPTLSISPVGNDGKDVWGLNETITYKAECNPGTGTHNAQFTNTQGLSGGGGSNTASATCSGSKSSTGTSSPLAAKCPDDGSHGAPTTSFKVVDIDYLSVDGVQKTNGATVYVEKAASGNVTIAATLTPSASASDLRSGFMSWTGGSAGADQLERAVTKTAVGSTTVTCKAGPNGTSWSVTIVVQITKTMTVSHTIPVVPSTRMILRFQVG